VVLIGSALHAMSRRHVQLRADDRLYAMRRAGFVELYGSGKGTMVRYGHRLIALFGDVLDKRINKGQPIN
jgi:hypothetical protein